MNQREVLAMAQDASRMPSRQAEYENLVLNRGLSQFALRIAGALAALRRPRC
jgi:hypothetical protein